MDRRRYDTPAETDGGQALPVPESQLRRGASRDAIPAITDPEFADVVNDTVGGRHVVVTVAPDDTLVAYERTVNGEPLAFAAGDTRTLTAGGSR